MSTKSRRKARWNFRREQMPAEICLTRRLRNTSKHAFVAETEITVVADDDMIEDAHAHDFADFF